MLVALAAAGLVLHLSREDLWPGARKIAPQLALLISAPVYLAAVGYQRAELGSSYAELSHHLYNTLVFTIPAIGIATHEFVRRWRWTGLVVGAFVVARVYINADFSPETRRLDLRPANLKRMECIVKGLAASPHLESVVARMPDRNMGFGQNYTQHVTPR